MADINHVLLIGNITKELELKKTQNGKSVVEFQIANNKDKENVNFFNIVAWNKTAELICQYLHKGSKLCIAGRLENQTYQNKQGQNVTKTYVVVDKAQFLDSRQNTQSNPTSNYAQQTQNYAQTQQNEFEKEFANDTLEIASDDLPF